MYMLKPFNEMKNRKNTEGPPYWYRLLGNENLGGSGLARQQMI